MNHTLSYAFFNGIGNAIDNKPYHIKFVASDYNMHIKLMRIISSMCKKMREHKILLKLGCEDKLKKLRAPTNYDDYWREWMNENKYYIVDCLMNNGHFVWNYYQKWYVVAFSLDYIRFNITAKDCDKKLIKWRQDDENDKIKPLRSFGITTTS